MNINGQSVNSTFTSGLSTDKIQDLGESVEINLTEDTIDLVGINVLVNGVPIDSGGSGVQNPLTSDLDIGVFDIIGLSNGATLQSINTDVVAVLEKTVNITSATFPTTTTMQGILTLDNLKTNDIKNILETSTIALNVGGIDITSSALNFNGSSVLTTPYPLEIEATSFVKTGGTNIQYLMANGSILTQSANSGNSNYYLYNNNTSLSPTPAIGDITFNTATQNTASMIYISHRTRDNVDIEVFFKQITTLTEIYIQDQETSLNYVQYNVLSTPVITLEAQVAISVDLRTGAGTGLTNFGNGHNLLVSFFTNSLEVDTRLSNLETGLTTTNGNVSVALSRTQYQFSGAGSTTFVGGQGIITDKFTRIGGGSGTEFVKSNGTFDNTTSTILTTLEDKTQNQTAVAGTTTLSGITDIATLKTDLITDRGAGGSQIFLTSGLVEVVASSMLLNNEEVVYNNFTSQLVAQSFRKTAGVSTEFLKADGSSDINKYNNIQFQLITAPASITNSIVETIITGTGASGNNMGLLWLDTVNNARKIEIFGTIRHLSSASLTIRFKYNGGTILLTWPITLSATAIGTAVPFQISIDYRVGTPNLYITNAFLTVAGSVSTTSYMATGSTASAFTNTLPYVVTAQWGTASPNNQLNITDFKIINRLI